MGFPQPRGESLRKAVRFVSQLREDEPELGRAALVERATLRFDLDPSQSDWLLRFVRDSEARERDDDAD